jgi:hypothetical protein
MSAPIPLTLFPFTDRDAPVEFTSSNGNITMEMNLKPHKDRVTFIGWSPALNDTTGHVLTEGFRIPLPFDRDYFVYYKTESLFYRKVKGVAKLVIRGIRYEDWFIDKIIQSSHKGTFLSVMKEIFKGTDYSFIQDSDIQTELADIQINISPGNNTTIRQILYELSIKHKFFWGINLRGGFFFTRKPLTTGDSSIDFSNLEKNPIGWQIEQQEGPMIPLGSEVKIGTTNQVLGIISRIHLFASQGSDSKIDYWFLDNETYDHVEYSTLKRAEMSTHVMYNDNEEIHAYSFPTKSSIDESNFNGDRIDDSKLIGNPVKIEKATVLNLEKLSPWATVDGHGIVFPHTGSEKFEHVSIVSQLNASKGVIVGDVVQDIEGNDGKTFILDLPYGRLQYSIEDEEWILSARESVFIDTKKIYLIDEGNDDNAVVRKKDLRDVVNTFNNHVHVITGTMPPGPLAAVIQKPAPAAPLNASADVYAK